MKYLFYPGCSMETSALEYTTSMLGVLKTLGAEIEELENWTCCGASVGAVMSDLLGVVLPARNLALAEKAGDGRELIAGCSACYTNLRKATEAARDRASLAKINQALEVENLAFRGTVNTRHLLDVLANDFDMDTIKSHVKRPLTGLTVAPYYGCQTVRPYSPFDDHNHPTSMVRILEALGAKVHHHLHEATCCGTALLTTKPEAGFTIAGTILEASSPADCIATVCPMCHMNLDSYQDKVSKVLGKTISIPVVFLPQLMGLAFGLEESTLLFKRLMVSAKPMLERVGAAQG
jgi:heterodisulfide reductase subunit B